MRLGFRVRCALLVIGALLSNAYAADLTAQESRWLQGTWPVLQHARAAGLPLDVVVQPQPAAGEAPLAMAFVDGRCKLVLTLRGHREAQTLLDGVERTQHDAVLELMAAHELGHCLRHVDGRWHVPPGATTNASPSAELSAEQRSAWREMQATRLEEGFADLTGLAWIARMRPDRYAALHAWLVNERTQDTPPGSHHDTLAWLRRAQDPRVFDGAESPFARVAEVWRAGAATAAPR